MLVGAALRVREAGAGEAAHLAVAFTRGAALGRFLVERLRDRCGAAHRQQRDDDDLEAFVAAADAQAMAFVHGLGRFRGFAFDVDLAAFDRLLGEAARLEEACGPQPDVEAHAVRGGARCRGLRAQNGIFPRRMSQYMTQSPMKL